MRAPDDQAQEAQPTDVEARRFSEDELVRVATDVLHGLGASEQTAHVVAVSLVLSNLVGHDSHGIVRLIQYSELGQNRPDPPRRRAQGRFNSWSRGHSRRRLGVRSAGGTARHRAGYELATAHGDCRRFHQCCATISAGSASMSLRSPARRRWVWRSATQGPIVAPFGGAGRVMGTNPYAWSAPLRDGVVVLDFATSKVAEGKLKIALAEGRTLPSRLASLTAQGRPSQDPADFYTTAARYWLLASTKDRGCPCLSS